jgi:hypothetical protein
MNYTAIEELIGKFYEGNTTPAEERQLREFFTRGEIPPHLAAHAGLFLFYEEERKVKVPDPDFEKRILAAMDDTPVVSLYSGKKQFLYLAGMAATFLLLIGLIFTFRNDVIKRSPGTAETETAYLQAQQVLLMISANLNTGLDQAQKLGNFQKGLDQAGKLQTFQKGIEQMNKFSAFYKYQPLNMNPGGRTRPQNH